MSPQFNPAIAGVGTHTITYTYTDINGCSNSATQSITVSAPVLELGADREICEGESTTISPTGTYSSYLWHDGSTGQQYTTSTEELVKLTVTDNNGCKTTDSLYVNVNSLPNVNLGRDTTLCGTESLILDAGSDGTQYTWSTGENTRYITIYEGMKTIWVKVINEYDCESGDTIGINACSLEDYFENIPNVITPNSDGSNDVWRIPELEAFPDATVEIYSRWGMLIFKSAPGYSDPWDGTSKGKELPMDAYYYIIYPGVAGAKPIVGNVTLIR